MEAEETHPGQGLWAAVSQSRARPPARGEVARRMSGVRRKRSTQQGAHGASIREARSAAAQRWHRMTTVNEIKKITANWKVNRLLWHPQKRVEFTSLWLLKTNTATFPKQAPSSCSLPPHWAPREGHHRSTARAARGHGHPRGLPSSRHCRHTAPLPCLPHNGEPLMVLQTLTPSRWGARHTATAMSKDPGEVAEKGSSAPQILFHPQQLHTRLGGAQRQPALSTSLPSPVLYLLGG